MSVDLEFIIQKEGDHAWLPLESSSVEILVGRYQLMAQASEAHYPINVHLQHQYIEDGLWQEEVQQHLLQTDAQGRIEVLPPTFLASGRWIITCEMPAADSPATPRPLSYTMQLQVLQQDADLDQEWDLSEAILIPQSLPQPMGPEDSWPRLTPIPSYAATAITPEVNIQSEEQAPGDDLDLVPPPEDDRVAYAATGGADEVAMEPLLAEDSLANPNLGDAYTLLAEADVTPSFGLEMKESAEITTASVPQQQSSEPFADAAIFTTDAADDFDQHLESHSLESHGLEDQPSLDEQETDLDLAVTPGLSSAHIPSERLELPEIPDPVPPLRLQISPGLILPPELYHPAPEETIGVLPQLPTFPHLDQWQHLSLSELSLALGRLRCSKLDTYGPAIDLDFHALELQRQFLQTLIEMVTEGDRLADGEQRPDGAQANVAIAPGPSTDPNAHC